MSENSIEKLDISALQELRSVRCARNHLTELTLCGRNLISLIAGNNSEYKLLYELLVKSVKSVFKNSEKKIRIKRIRLK